MVGLQLSFDFKLISYLYYMAKEEYVISHVATMDFQGHITGHQKIEPIANDYTLNLFINLIMNFCMILNILPIIEISTYNLLFLLQCFYKSQFENISFKRNNSQQVLLFFRGMFFISSISFFCYVENQITNDKKFSLLRPYYVTFVYGIQGGRQPNKKFHRLIFSKRYLFSH